VHGSKAGQRAARDEVRKRVDSRRAAWALAGVSNDAPQGTVGIDHQAQAVAGSDTRTIGEWSTDGNTPEHFSEHLRRQQRAVQDAVEKSCGCRRRTYEQAVVHPIRMV